MKKMEGEKNKIISLYTEIDEIKSARIRKLEHDQAQSFESLNQFQQLTENRMQSYKELVEQVSRFKEHLEMKLELIMILKRTISEQEIVIHLLKEQVASLEEEKL